MFGSRITNTGSAVKWLILLVFLTIFTAKSYAQLGGPPVIVVQPLGVAVQNGGNAVLGTTAISQTSMNFTWYYNGKKVTGNRYNVINVAIPLVGTVSTLTVNSVSNDTAGTYSVSIKNSAGTVVSSNAVLVVLAPIITNIVSNVVNFVSAETGMTTSGFKLKLSCPTGSNVVIHASSDLMNWSPISTNTSTSGTVTFTDTNAMHVTCRFYRAVIR